MRHIRESSARVIWISLARGYDLLDGGAVGAGSQSHVRERRDENLTMRPCATRQEAAFDHSLAQREDSMIFAPFPSVRAGPTEAARLHSVATSKSNRLPRHDDKLPT